MSTDNDFNEEIPLIKIEDIKKIEQFQHLSNDEFKEIVYSMHLWGVLTYDIFNKYSDG